MVIIFDELAPGNKLNYENRRKLMLMSLSFLQLEETLRVDDSWSTALAARASIVGDVCGGIKAHGKGDIKPKHHWMFDVAEMLDWETKRSYV